MSDVDLIRLVVGVVCLLALLAIGLPAFRDIRAAMRQRRRRRAVMKLLAPQPKFYLLQPGWVISQTDDEEHYISADKLAALYGVRQDNCLVESQSDYERGRFNRPEFDHLIRLAPRHDGVYVLPGRAL